MKNIFKAVPEAVIVGFAMSLLAFISFNCVDMPLQPIAPSSDIQLSMPIADVTHYVLEWVQKSPSLTLIPDGSGTFSYLYNQSMPPQGINPIPLQPQGSSQQVAVGQFAVNGFFKNDTILATTISPSLSGTLPGLLAGSFPIPAVPISNTTFDYVRIASGTLTLTITNNLPVPIDFPNPIVLHNNWTNPLDNSVIASFSITGVINPGASLPVPVVIDGKLLRGSLTTDPIQLHTSGSLSPITFTPSSELSISFQSTNLTADSASAVIPNQTVDTTKNALITLDSTIAIQNAQFSQGSFDFALINRSNVTVGVSIIVNDIVNITTQNSLRIDATLQGQDSLTTPIDFTKYQIKPSAYTSTSKGTDLSYSVLIRTINSGVNKTVITKNDFVRAEIRPKNSFLIKSITGRIKPQTLLVNQGINTNFPGLQDIKDKLRATLNFRGVSIKLRLPITGGGFPMDYNLKLVSKNSSTGTVDTLGIPANSTGQFRITPGGATSEIDLSSAPGFNTFLTHFFSFPNLPDSMSIRGSVVLSPTDVSTSGQAYTIDDASKVYPRVVLTFPSEIGIQNGQYNDVVAMSEENNNQDFTNKMLNARINITATNGIPLSVKFSVKFLSWNKFAHHSDTTLTLVPDSTFLPANVNATSGIVTGPVTSYISIMLDTAQVRKFNSSDSVAINLILSTSNNGAVPVVITTNQAIRLRASANLTYRIQGKQ